MQRSAISAVGFVNADQAWARYLEGDNISTKIGLGRDRDRGGLPDFLTNRDRGGLPDPPRPYLLYTRTDEISRGG